MQILTHSRSNQYSYCYSVENNKEYTVGTFAVMRKWSLQVLGLALAIILFLPNSYGQCDPDITPPICVPMNITVSLDAADMAMITGDDVDGGSSDNCELVSITVDPDAFTCAEVGINVVELTLEDAAGNITDDCFAQVTVLDETPPECIGADFSVDLDAMGMATIVFADVDGGSTDNCALDELSVAPDAFTCDDIGDVVVTLTVTDESSNIDLCTATVTVNDVTIPICIAQNITVSLDATGHVEFTVDDIDAGSFDECCLDEMQLDFDSFDCDDVGDNAVQLSIVDCSGNPNFCVAVVTVEDNMDPICMTNNATVYLDGAGAGAIIEDDVVTAADNCDVNSIVAAPLAFTCADKGTNDVLITITDDEGNETECTAIVTVLDLVAPICVPMDIVVDLTPDGTVTIVPADIDGGSVDNCTFTLSAFPTVFTCTDVGDNDVTLLVTDDCDNVAECTAVVTVNDIEAPICTPIDVTVCLDQDGMASILPEEVATVEDNCCIEPWTVDVMDFTCADIGDVDVTITAMDCNMNAATPDPCIATVTVEDKLAPECQAGSEEVDLLPEECEAVVAYVLPDLIDNCDGPIPGVLLPGEPATGTVFGTGTTVILYEGEDASGNADTCEFLVIVNEFVPQGLACQNINLSLDETCSGVVTPIMVLTGDSFGCLDSCVITITDPWGNEIPNDFGSEHVGQTFGYEICCNGLCCWGEVQVDYKFPPKIDCPVDVTIACNALNDVDSYLPITEFCAPGELVLINETIDNLECDDDYLKVVTRTYKAIDMLGNESTECTFDIYLERVNLDYIECPANLSKLEGTALSCDDDLCYDDAGFPLPICENGVGTGVPVYVIPEEILFDDSGMLLGTLNSRDALLCDLDGDGDLDAFVANISPNGMRHNKVYFNDGTGNFTDSGQVLGNLRSRGVDLADLDGDGDKDAFIANRGGQPNKVWLNDGTGNFTDSGQNLGAFDSHDVSLCDIDADGDIDAFVSNSGGQANMVWLNDGMGVFTDSGQTIGANDSRSVAWMDVNGDGFKDAIVANNLSDNLVYINDGTGNFTDSGQNLGSGATVDLEICDLDGDGDEDVFVVDAGGGPNEVYLNNGNGSFANTMQMLGTGSSREVVLFDINCDGFKDAVVANAGDNTVWINNGNAVFTDAGLALAGGNTYAVSAGDVDGDGDEDLFFANNTDPNQIFYNNSECETELSLFPDVSGELCNVFVSYTDVEIPVNDCTRKIMRSWSVREWWCGDEIPTGCFQLIEITDTLGPVFTCPTEMAMTTTTHDCEADVLLPAVEATDNCSEIGHVRIEWPTGFLETNGGIGHMPIGNHLVTYTVFDECYNYSSCSTYITVGDNTEPIALCEQNTVVSIGSSQHAIVYAETFDDGSFDDCYIDSVRVIRMSTPCPDYPDDVFAEKVHFCCADVGDPDIMVQMRVWDSSGNFNDCMVNVEVQDKVAPSMDCINDITVLCTDPLDLDNLGLTAGYPTITDNCASPDDLDEDVTDNRNQCGTGSIIRRMILEDAESNTEQVCIQNIIIVNDDPFVYGDIFWPRDTTFYDMCSIDGLDPEELPAGYNKPIFDEDECELIGYNYEDEIFTFVDGEEACLKIIRKWSVIDWCGEVIDGEYVRWSEDQILKVHNTIDPEISEETCSPIVVESANVDCSDVNIEIIGVASDDCTPEELLDWEYSIDYFSDGSVNVLGDNNDASGAYPIGVHTITWTVEDNCGNYDTCESTVEVVNVKAPVPVCIQGLSVNLVPMDLDGDGEIDAEMATLWASEFDASSYHPCGDYDITFSFSPDITDTSITFDCDDCGIQTIQMWVTDENGNQSYCETFVDVQDNNDVDFCPECRISIQGRIATEDGLNVPEVNVDLDGSTANELTNENGIYVFDDMGTGGTYQVIPLYNQNPLNGVSTLDIVKIQRHVLGIQNLESVYDIIAADANNSGSISAQDLLDIRRMILGVISAFPNNTSWRFVDKAQNFLDPLNPWSQGIDESYMIPTLEGNMIIDFVGIKTADVNGSATMFADDDSETRNGRSIALHYDVVDNQVLITTAKDLEFEGLQLALDLQDYNLVELSSTMNIDETHFNQIDDVLLISYPEAEFFNAGEVLFTLELDEEIPVVGLDNALQAELYVGEELEIVDIKLDRKPTEGEGFVRNYPNPWMNETIIEFEADQDGQAILNFYDVKGAVIKSLTVYAAKGYNTVSIPKTYFETAGMKTYQLKLDDKVYFGKMLLLE